ncbi:hypothetical protein [Priestia megaterium]|uniref:hypothetical protein n=1 Tax=Priestia megaterium TaxID=1404 RepID=UPI0015D4FB3B|nr:hypothetical protein [Priestia megaterium]
MNNNLDINTVLEIYKSELSTLNHELILSRAMITQLQQENEQLRNEQQETVESPAKEA